MAVEKLSEGIRLFAVDQRKLEDLLPPNYKPATECYMSRKDLANAIRALSMDAVQKPILVIPARRWAWLILPKCCGTIFLNITPPTQLWYDRDRFILSNGRASMLLYSLLHLTGYDLPLEELKNFRQLHSKTLGHPEIGYTPC